MMSAARSASTTVIAYDHPNLQGNWAQSSSWDFVNGDNSRDTHVSGTIAALDNNTGVAGVAPQAKIAALKVLNSSGNGKWSDIIEALDWAVDHGARVTNNSYGSNSYPYASYSGASMASPHVCGLVALLLGAGLDGANDNGKLSDEVRDILSKTATDLGAKGRDALSYAKAGKDLNISVTVKDGGGKAMAGAAVAVKVTKGGAPYVSGSANTAANGIASFQIKNAPKACYSTDVTGVTGPNLTYDGSEPANNFCL